MKMTEDVRKFVMQRGVSEKEALESGIKRKAHEFQRVRSGGLSKNVGWR
jgi:hypothetical protein